MFVCLEVPVSGAVDKLVELSGQGPRTEPAEDPAGDLVLAARTALTELRAQLASGDDDDDDDGDSGDDDHSSHGTYKALVKRGMDKSRAASMCAKSDKKVKACRLAETALIALAGLDVPGHDWVEATAAGLDSLKLSGAGVGAYADPGYRGKARLPVDTAEHTRMTLSYVSQGTAERRYSADQLAAIRSRAYMAARQFDIALAADDEKIAAGVLLSAAALTAAERRTAVGLAAGTELDAAADVLALAKPTGDGGIIMNHAPWTGSHEHGHFQGNVHKHPHQHFGDNSHDGGPAHRPGSKPGGRPGW